MSTPSTNELLDHWLTLIDLQTGINNKLEQAQING